MTPRLALLSLALLAGPAAAQPADGHVSHVPIPLPSGGDGARLFADRLQQSQLRTDLDELLKRLRSGNPAALADAPRQLEQLLRQNPELRDRLDALVRDNPALLNGVLDSVRQSNPGLAGLLTPERFQQQLDRLARPDREVPERPPGNGKGRGKAPPRPPAAKADARPAPETGPRPAEPPRPPVDPIEQRTREMWAQNLSKLAERFDRDQLVAPLRDSPAISNLIDRLTRTGADALRSGAGREGIDAQLARWQRRLAGMRDWLPGRPNVRLYDFVSPRVADLPRPNIRLPRFNFNAPSLPSARGLRASATGMLDLLQGVLMLLLAAAVAVVLWRLLGARAENAAAVQRGLGPWPLDPARVATRADLIRAFEYLSLLRCGEQARTWHHRAIANRLGGSEGQRRRAAARLAELYEQARYTPDTADLTGPAFADARRHLTYLAGTAGA